ncbi:hypothetical protein [Aestuariimicrobium sp. Y1814]|uniref:hypothetical protein n=1 Tax=Aestuariimicrobium sp. Y1814 TaxID=3418742 RepID=UPI003DA74304
MTAQPISLGLNRPQYVATPEALVSALAWRQFHAPDAPPNSGLMYRTDNKGAGKVQIITTYPESSDQLRQFGEALTSAGFSADMSLPREQMALAFADAVLGIKPEKGQQHPAAPLTPHLALLQSMRGYQRTMNPPDLGLILEQLYALGVPTGSRVEGPSTRWLRAAEHKTANDPVLGRLDKAAAEALLPRGLVRVTPSPVDGRAIADRSPFTWFVNAWNQLTDDRWVDALPARVWVDWCCTVLRLGLGLGFLWETLFYDQYGRSRMRGEQPDARDIANLVAKTELVPWAPSDAHLGVRDVASLLLGRIRRGDAVRKLLDRDQFDDRDIDEALNNPGTAGNNVWEAIKYALKSREESGRYADHYGLLRSRGRFTFVEPGAEWITVLAGLTAGGPGRPTTVNRLMSTLFDMGLRPELRDVVLLLETAGLTRGSADADDALEITNAY